MEGSSGAGVPGALGLVVRIAAVDKTFVSDHARVTTALQGIDLDIRRPGAPPLAAGLTFDHTRGN